MGKIELVIADCDDCLLKYIEAFLKRYPDYHAGEMFPQHLNKEFRCSEALKCLEPCDGAEYFVKSLNNAGIPIRICTALGYEEIAQDNRMFNLNHRFGLGSFDQIHFVGCGESKADALIKIGYGYDPERVAFVDDMLCNIMVSPYLNIWNKHPDSGIIPSDEDLSRIAAKVSNMREAADYILGLQ